MDRRRLRPDLRVRRGCLPAIGSTYTGRQAVELIDALSRSGLHLGSVTAATLALMPALAGMKRCADEEFDIRNYR